MSQCHFSDITVTDIDGEEHEGCEVAFDYIPAERGDRERGTGLALEPDYPEEINDFKVSKDGKEIKVSEKVMDKILRELKEEV